MRITDFYPLSKSLLAAKHQHVEKPPHQTVGSLQICIPQSLSVQASGKTMSHRPPDGSSKAKRNSSNGSILQGISSSWRILLGTCLPASELVRFLVYWDYNMIRAQNHWFLIVSSDFRSVCIVRFREFWRLSQWTILENSRQPFLKDEYYFSTSSMNRNRDGPMILHSSWLSPANFDDSISDSWMIFKA